MAATFQPDLSRPLDQVRFSIGDTDLEHIEIEDETITALLNKPGATVLSVSVILADGLASKYARKVTYDVDGQGERFSDIAANYRALSDRLAGLVAKEVAAGASEEAVAASQALGGGIMVGGISRRQNLTRLEDEDRAANYPPIAGV